MEACESNVGVFKMVIEMQFMYAKNIDKNTQAVYLIVIHTHCYTFFICGKTQVKEACVLTQFVVFNLHSLKLFVILSPVNRVGVMFACGLALHIHCCLLVLFLTGEGGGP